MKRFVDKKIRYVKYQIGNQVVVNLYLIQHNKGYIRGSYGGMKGILSILKRIRIVSYKLELPPKLKLHLIFHVSMFKLYHEDKEDP